ncbi:MAG: hypothetical protein V4684_14100 [Pseudomonadota bacterium]|jgi:hypothetical protein
MSDLKTSSEQMQKEGYWLRGPDLGYTYGPGMLMLDTEGRDRPPVAMAQWAQAVWSTSCSGRPPQEISHDRG